MKMFVDLNLKLGVRPEAYAPLSAPSWKNRRDKLKDMNVLKDPVILSLAEKYHKTPAQVVLNWHLHGGHVVIPSSMNRDRQKENLDIFDFTMTHEEYERVTLMDEGARMYDPKYYSEYERPCCPYFD